MSSSDKYWADEPPDSFRDDLKKRTNEYYDNLRNTSFYLWMRKSWKLYNNILGRDKTRDKGIAIAGEQGEYCIVGINNFRNLIKNLLILVTGNKPTFKCSPINNESKSIDQSRLGEDIVEYYLAEKRLEDYWVDTAESALVLGEGYISITWDPNDGEEWDQEEATEEEVPQEEVDEDGEPRPPKKRIVRQGDLRFAKHEPLDVVWDRNYEEFRRAPWCAIRAWANRWDCLSRYPDAKDDILNAGEDTERLIVIHDFNTYLETYSPTGRDPNINGDLVPVWEFYHRKTDSIPEGRYVKIVGNAVLIDMELPYEDMPVFQMLGGKTKLTGYGYTPAFDLIALQEILNATWSTLVTELRRKAGTNLRINRGDKVDVTNLQGGGRVLETNGPIDVLDLGAVPQDIWQTIGLTNQYMELLSGINSITRGSIDAKLSGTAYALLDSKSIQFANDLVRNYYKMLEETATFAVRVIRDFASTERVLMIVGQDKRGIAQVSFTPDDLSDFNRFFVSSQNPIFKTTGGKMEVADKLLQTFGPSGGIIPQEYISLIETGQLDPVYESGMSEITNIRRENEALLRGEEVISTRYDIHPLHIQEHKILIANPVVRRNPDALERVLAHILQHRNLWDYITINEPSVAQILGIPPSMPPQAGSPPPPQGGEVQPGAGGQAGMVMNRPIAERPEVQVRPARPAQPPVPPIQQ